MEGHQRRAQAGDRQQQQHGHYRKQVVIEASREQEKQHDVGQGEYQQGQPLPSVPAQERRGDSDKGEECKGGAKIAKNGDGIDDDSWIALAEVTEGHVPALEAELE